MGEKFFSFGHVYFGDGDGNYLMTVPGEIESIETEYDSDSTLTRLDIRPSETFTGTFVNIMSGHAWGKTRKLLMGWKLKSPMRSRELVRAMRMIGGYR